MPHPLDLERIWTRTVERYPYLREIPPFKSEWLYALYNETLPPLSDIKLLVELGIYQGGSLILWREALNCNVIGVDLSREPDTMMLVDRYIRDSGSAGSITCLWRTDQGDARALRKVVEEHGGSIDVVIDDASHLYIPTRRSFDILFPLVREGGLYFIEDWAAGLRADFQSAEGPVSRILGDAIDLLAAGAMGLVEVDVRPGAARIVKARRRA